MLDIENMTPLGLITLRAGIAITAAVVGGLLGMGRRHVSHRVLCALVSLAAGALLGVTVADIIPETIELSGRVWGAISIIVGTAVFAVVNRYVYFMCPACAASASEHDTGYLRLGILLMVAMGIHSTVDGLAISAGSVSMSQIGVIILLAVSYHKVPEGMALVSLARLAGFGRAKALGVTVLIELTTAVGALIGILVLQSVTGFSLGVILGLVAGSFLYTVGFAMLKEMYAHEKGSIIIYVLLGFVSILVIGEIISRSGIHAH